MKTRHGFCPLHRIAYDRSLDATCPQCTIAHIQPPEQLDYQEVPVQQTVTRGSPVDASGSPIEL